MAYRLQFKEKNMTDKSKILDATTCVSLLCGSV